MSDDPNETVVLMEPMAAALRDRFIGWQCRLRQLAVREEGGRPSSGMRPQVLAPSGKELSPGIIVLIVPDDPDDSAALFRYQALRTMDPVERQAKAIELLSANYFQYPKEFSDVMTALFGPDSALADRLLDLGRCYLVFEQYQHVYRLPCTVLQLNETDPAYQATYWHNRLYNPNLPGGVRILSFTPDWTHASHKEPD